MIKKLLAKLRSIFRKSNATRMPTWEELRHYNIMAARRTVSWSKKEDA